MSKTTYARALALSVLLAAAAAEAQPVALPEETPHAASAPHTTGPQGEPPEVDGAVGNGEAEPQIAEVLTDDSARVTIALGRGVRFESLDDRFMLNIRARAQLLATALGPTEGANDGSVSFQARRVRLLLQGHLFGPEWQYYVQLGFSNRDTESDLRLPLRDAYMTWTGLRDLNVRFGQMKVPHDRQRVNSSSALQFVDRSIVTSEFNLDRDVGIQLFSNDVGGLGSRLAYSAGMFGGEGRNRFAGDVGLLYVARVSYLPFGAFEDYVEADHARSPDGRLAFTAGFAYNQNSTRSRSTFQDTYQLGSFDFFHASVDMLFKLRGFSFLTQVFYRDVRGSSVHRDDSDPVTPIIETARVGYGAFAQAGYLFTDNLELVARFGEIRPSRQSDSALTRQGELGGGLNWYFQKHDFKMQLDYFWLYGDGVEDGRHQVRIQSQFFL